MNRVLIWQLAIRYLRGKRSANAVPVLSRISMVAIAVGSCAMIVLFSVFNGFELLIKDLYKAFYPEIKITAERGKFFSIEANKVAQIKALKGVQDLTRVIEDKVLLNSNSEQQVAVLKGVEPNYFQINNVKPYVYDGKYEVSAGAVPTAFVGLHIANELGLDINNVFSRLSVYYPNPHADAGNLNLSTLFQSIDVKPDGVFRVQDEFDSKFVLVAMPVAQELFIQPSGYSSVELSLNKGADIDNIRKALADILGGNFVIETRFEQNKTLYMVMQTEKWAVYAILLLVLLIASFNMVGALSLLVLEKQKDIAILKAMGATSATVRKIFVTEGLLWAMVGGGLGLLLGAALCMGQSKFQWIKLEGDFIIEAYPVKMQGGDFLLIIVTIVFVGLLASWYPARRATKAVDPSLKAD
jgi:lipoprotein-releasing system permease protein